MAWLENCCSLVWLECGMRRGGSGHGCRGGCVVPRCQARKSTLPGPDHWAWVLRWRESACPGLVGRSANDDILSADQPGLSRTKAPMSMSWFGAPRTVQGPGQPWCRGSLQPPTAGLRGAVERRPDAGCCHSNCQAGKQVPCDAWLPPPTAGGHRGRMVAARALELPPPVEHRLPRARALTRMKCHGCDLGGPGDGLPGRGLLGDTASPAWWRGNQRGRLQPDAEQGHTEVPYGGRLAVFLPLVTLLPACIHAFLHALPC